MTTVPSTAGSFPLAELFFDLGARIAGCAVPPDW